MGNLFKSPKPAAMPPMPAPPPLPKPVRMPVENDPALQAASERGKRAIRRRRGRESTIMTDQTLSGSPGGKLGR